MAERPSFATGGRIAPPGIPVSHATGEIIGRILHRLGPFRVPSPDLSKLPQMKATIRPKEDRMDDLSPRERGLKALEKAEELLYPTRREQVEGGVDRRPEIVEQLGVAREAFEARRTGADYLYELEGAAKEYAVVCAEREVLIGLLLDGLPEPVADVFHFPGEGREYLEQGIRDRAQRLMAERARPSQDEAMCKAERPR